MRLNPILMPVNGSRTCVCVCVCVCVRARARACVRACASVFDTEERRRLDEELPQVRVDEVAAFGDGRVDAQVLRESRTRHRHECLSRRP
jgi:hypothetical protein